ncbi:hypothetical protein [uncultured archaeal virus]|uniref:Uncharacterized protein n=1 Tax=uncultured archaeal virus TaxID=1960247 RepID=A0A8B0LSD5_9VIRU|nr:hypothetical protein [uncultured archaeal virus]
MDEKIKFEFMTETEKKTSLLSVLSSWDVISFSDVQKEFELQEIEINKDVLNTSLEELINLKYIDVLFLDFGGCLDPYSWYLSNAGRELFIELTNFLLSVRYADIDKPKWFVKAQRNAEFIKNYYNIQK